MKIQIYSDLHLEFHQDRWFDFVDKLDVSEADVVVLAGDIGIASDILAEQLDAFCKRSRHVVYVSGNHEYYCCCVIHGSRTSVNSVLADVDAKNLNFHWLRNNVVTIDGQRFLGNTMWFPRTTYTDLYWNRLNDYHRIKDFAEWVHIENASTVEFLKANIREGDVVVTHHAPSEMSAEGRYKNDRMNDFYVSDMSNVMLDQNPALWIHGHMHGSSDYTIGNTRIVANAYAGRGFLRHEENPNFNEKLIVEV